MSLSPRVVRIGACLFGILAAASAVYAASTTTYTYDAAGNLTGVTGCASTTCAAQGKCGSIPNGCGGMIWCGCGSDQFCNASSVCESLPLLSLSTASLAFNGRIGDTNPAAQTVIASNSGGGTLAVPTTSISYGYGSGWLNTSVSGSVAPFTVTVTPNISGLTHGTYTATVSVSSAGTSSGPRTVNVTLTVAPSVSTPVLLLSTTSLTFSGTVGGSNPATETVIASNSGGGTLAIPATTVSYGSGSGWLSTSVSGSAALYAITVTPNLLGLNSGTYSATVSVSSTGAAGSPQSVNVIFIVNPSGSGDIGEDIGFPVTERINCLNFPVDLIVSTGGTNRLLVASANYSWGPEIGDTNLAAGLTVSGAGLTWTRAVYGTNGVDASSQIWFAWAPPQLTYATITVTPNDNGNFFITVEAFYGARDPTGLITGTDYAAATATATGISSPAVVIPSVTTKGASGSWLLGSASLGDMSSGGGSPRTYDANNVETSAWVEEYWVMWTVQRNTPLSAGTYSIGDSGPATRYGWSMVAVEVLGSSPPALSLSKTSLAFIGTAGGSSPAPLTVTASNIGGGTLATPTTSISYGSGNGWLSTSVSGSATPYTVTVTPSISGLSAGIYTATVSVNSTGASSSPQTVNVTLTVAPAASTPVLSLSPASLTFSGTVGGANPAAKTVTVTNSGGGTLAVPTTSVSYGSGSGWLSTSVSGSAAPYAITVTPSVSGLGAGTYNATVSVSSTGATNSPQSVSVTLTVASSGTSTIAEDAGFPAARQIEDAQTPFGLIVSTGGANRLLVVSVNCAWSTAAGLTVSGGGLSWKRAVYSTSGTEASSQIWFAWTPSQLTNETITVTPDTGDSYLVTVDVLAGTRDPTGLTPGTDYAVATATGIVKPAVVIPSVTTKGTSGSWLLGSAALSYGGSPRTYDANNVETSSWITSGVSALWTQRRAGPLSAGTYSIGTTGPAANYEWSMVAFEVLAGSGGSPALSLSKASLTFSGTAGGSNPTAQTITSTNSGGGTLAVPTTSVSYGSGSGWLNTSVSGSAAPYTITITPNMSGLSPGTYTATVSVSSAGAINSPRSVTVTLIVWGASTIADDAGFPAAWQIEDAQTPIGLIVSTGGTNRLLVVSVNCAWSTAAGLTVSGGGLTWKRAVYSTSGTEASSQIWFAWAPSQLTYETITVTPDTGDNYLVTVDVLSGARDPTDLTDGTDYAVATATGLISPAAIIPSVTTKGTSGSWLLGSAALSYGGSPRTYDTNNVETSSWITSGVSALWTQRRAGPLSAGTYSIGTTGPFTSYEWSMVAFEVLAQ